MTNHTNQNIAQPIYDLIAILDDAKKGYLNAAEKIKDEVLSLLFERFGYQRGRYSNELRKLASELPPLPVPVPRLLLVLTVLKFHRPPDPAKNGMTWS